MIAQVFKFSLVGVTALLVHWLVVLLLVSLGWAALLANCYGFAVAFSVSYLGHRRWTFETFETAHSMSLPRFILMSLSGFMLNETLFYLLLKFTSLNYQLALFLVLGIVALLTFSVSKFWVFKSL